MAIYRCKGCGGELRVGEDKTVAECDYCGVMQTVPSAKDENLQGLFNRANTLRMKSEFDKAEQIYERIIQADSTQAEAYWGLILCKFGIEYVEDPVSYKRVPTCHRASLDSIIADDDYKSALLYADQEQRSIYEADAKEIDRLQREIIALSQREDAYDVFICYKETDGTGRRTQDSVIANDIYYQLTQEGFKVFFAAITLEDKLGSAYEPCIFAALNSAKVMLSIGTKPEYFSAVWVKNEWSRFLKIMKKDRSKVLIPCYKDMDAYELPEEFAHLQAQDMSKIGFINDVVRGIKKVLSGSTPKAEVKNSVTVNRSNANTAPLLQRVSIFLEDGDWASANEYCEKVLDLEPQNADAYLGKLMAELRVRTLDGLAVCNESLEQKGNYQKAVRFADDDLKNRITRINQAIQERIKIEKLNETYNHALSLKNSAATEADYRKAASIFDTIPEWKVSAEQARECLQKAEEIRKENIYQHCKKVYSGAVSETEEKWLDAQKGFESISGWKDSDELARVCAEQARTFKQRKTYAQAVAMAKEQTEEALTNAIALLRGIESWQDSTQLIMQYEGKIAELAAIKEASYNCALRDLEDAICFDNAKKYGDAIAAYQAAEYGFTSVGDFRDSKRKADWCTQKRKAMETSAMPTLTFAVLDSMNPLALANGAHYVYEIRANYTRKTQQVTVELRKGISTQKVKLEPGDYTIELSVYGWNTKPGSESPMHSKSCSIQLAWGESCKIVSNRPVFGGLKMNIEKHSHD